MKALSALKEPLSVTSLKSIPLTDEVIEAAFVGTNFGSGCKRDLLAKSVLKRALGFHCGHTITKIMIEMGLVTPKLMTITRLGAHFCYEKFDCKTGG